VKATKLPLQNPVFPAVAGRASKPTTTLTRAIAAVSGVLLNSRTADTPRTWTRCLRTVPAFVSGRLPRRKNVRGCRAANSAASGVVFSQLLPFSSTFSPPHLHSLLSQPSVSAQNSEFPCNPTHRDPAVGSYPTAWIPAALTCSAITAMLDYRNRPV